MGYILPLGSSARGRDEEAYELLYNVDEGRGFESMQVCKRIYSERVGAIGPSEKKGILMVIRGLPREELDKLWPFELDDLLTAYEPSSRKAAKLSGEIVE